MKINGGIVVVVLVAIFIALAATGTIHPTSCPTGKWFC